MMKKPTLDIKPETIGDKGLTPPPPTPYPTKAQLGGMAPPAAQTTDANGFRNFVANTGFVKKIHDPNFPHRGAGVHVPVWLSPALAQHVLSMHAHTGHAIPHQNIDMDDLTK